MLKSLEIIETQFGNFIIDEYDLIGNYIKQSKVWEYHLYEIYSQMINKESYCIDAGANLGFHSIQFGRLGKKVYSFEPQSYVYNQLCTNILFNGLDNIIEAHKLGLGDKEEKKQMWNIEHESWVGNGTHNWGGRGIIPNIEDYNTDRAIKNENREEDIIKVITLDSLNIPKCNLIKVDVQGYEYKLFMGASKLINKFFPTIFLENSIGGEEDLKLSLKTKEYLIELGYEFYRLHIGNKEDCILIHSNNSNYNANKEIINKFTEKYNIIKE
jgi:FkbM family methyltransferase